MDIQAILNKALPHYKNQRYMCLVLYELVQGEEISVDECKYVESKVMDFILPHVFLFGKIKHFFNISDSQITEEDLRVVGIAIYSDWKNRDKTLEKYKTLYWEHQKENQK